MVVTDEVAVDPSTTITGITQGIRPYKDPAYPKYFRAEIVWPEEDIRLERRIFDIQTYAPLSRNLSAWDNIQQANVFIATMDRDEYDYFVRLFVQAKRFLSQVRDGDSLMEAVKKIDEKVAKTFERLFLPDRIFSYVNQDKNIIIPDFSDVVMRPQDTEEKTFRETEYHLINTIIIISKLLFPIFGEIICKIQQLENGDSYSGVKEIITFGIMNTLLERNFGPIINKLFNYISEIVNRHRKNDDMLVFHGVTETSLAYDKLAKMMVKNFVNHDLYKQNGNIMTYISVFIKRSVSVETNGSAKNVMYRERDTPELNGDDGRNLSYMENALNTSNEPVETAPIVKLAIKKFISDYLERNNISREVFEQAVGFYRIKSIPPTPINELLVAMFIADPVGSAYSVKYLSMDEMIRVIVLIQIYASRMGFNSLIPMLSLIDTGVEKRDLDAVDNNIIISEGRGTGAVNYGLYLKEATSHLEGFPNFDFNELMKGVYTFIVSYVHTFSVAPSILSLGSTGTTTTDETGVLKYDKDIVSEITRFMYHILLANPERMIA